MPPDFADAYVNTSLHDGVLTITLGAGKAHPLSMAMLQQIEVALIRAEADSDVRVVVIHGPGTVFCAGHDLKEIARHRSDADQGRDFLKALFDQCAVVMRRLTEAATPTIAMVDGLATAAGVQIVAACDLAFVSPVATFCMPGVNNGGFCSTPAVAVGRSIARKHVMEMALSGDVYDADWAMSVGLVNRVVASAELAQTVDEFARKLAARHAPAVSRGKQTFFEQLPLPLDQAYDLASDAMLEHFMDPWRVTLEKDSWGKA